MIPMLADLTIETPRRRFRLWLPLFLVWVLLLPFFLVALPFAAIACAVFRINPFRALGLLFALLAAVSGTEVAVQRRRTFIFIRIV
ncbi:MAG: hypothetical protein IT534_06305 [Bauldia sp.]|nr:hypothetical protein [Bauldia sp.]